MTVEYAWASSSPEDVPPRACACVRVRPRAIITIRVSAPKDQSSGQSKRRLCKAAELPEALDAETVRPFVEAHQRKKHHGRSERSDSRHEIVGQR